jgi:hypothetical protein
VEEKERGIRSCSPESEFDDELSESSELGTWCLAQPIEGLVEQAHGIRAISIDKTSRLLAKHVFLEMPMEKSIGDIELFGWPAPRHCDGEHCPDSGGLHYRRERLPEVDASPLSEPTNHPPSLIAFQSSIGIQFMFEDPFPSQMLPPGGRSTRRQVRLC